MIYGPEPITLRRLEVLVRGLPLESKTARELGAVKPGEWTNVEELLAGVAEIMADFRNLFVLANRDPKKPKPRLPEVRVPRPGSANGQDRAKKKPASGAELAAFIGHRGMVHYTPKKNDPGSVN